MPAASAATSPTMRARVRRAARSRWRQGFAAMRAARAAGGGRSRRRAPSTSRCGSRSPGATNEATRKLLLEQAGLRGGPFQAFGLEDSGWFRISVGAVSLAEIDAALPRVRPPRFPDGERGAAGRCTRAWRSCCGGAVPVRREQAWRRGDAGPDRGADGARAGQRRPAPHLLPVRAAAHDADAAVHRPRSATRRARRATSRCWRGWRCSSRSWLFARRLVGRERAPLAPFALAVSPLHLQASTTAASEALYLLLWVGALERLARGPRLERRRRPPRGVRDLCSGRRAGVAGGASPATTPGWRCPSWSAAAFRLAPNPRAALPGLAAVCGRGGGACPSAGSSGVGWPAAIRCSSPTTSAPITPGWRPPPPARYGVRAGAAASARDLDAGLCRRMTQPGLLLAGRALARVAVALASGPVRGPRRAGAARRSIWRAGFCLRASSRWPGLPSSRATCCCRWPWARCRSGARGPFASPPSGCPRPSRSRSRRASWAHTVDGDARIWAGAESMGALTRLDAEDRGPGRVAARPPPARRARS